MVWDDKGIGNIVGNNILKKKNYGGKCIDYRIWRKKLKKYANTLQKIRDLDDEVEKNAGNSAKSHLDSFFGHVWHSLIWEAPTRGKRLKKAPIGRIPRGGAKSWPWTNRAGDSCEAFWNRDANIMPKWFKKIANYIFKFFSPCYDSKKTCGVGGHPTRSEVNIK